MFDISFTKGELSQQAINMISAIELEAAKIIETRDEMRAALLKAMEECGIKKLDTPELTVSYIAPTDRENFDKRALKSDMPDIYEAYASFSPVKSSIRVKLK